MSKPSWIGYSLSDRYRIDQLLGQGGMSAVYLATDANLGRQVAVKLIHPHMSDDEAFLRRFETEASAVAGLSHPNIIQVYDFNHDAGTYYMVLEYIDGDTLHDRLRQYQRTGTRMDYADVANIAAYVCDAVHYAHERGTLHRDIKPGNVMIRQDGRVVLADFGIAKILGGTNLTGSGAVVGTVHYMAPEVVQGGHDPDRRIDVYAIGVMLFEMVGGQMPFDADSAISIMMKHMSEPIPDLRELAPDVPDALVAVIERAMAKNPDDRYQTAADMAQALRKAAASKDVAIPKTEMLSTTPATTIEPELTPDQTAQAMGQVSRTEVIPTGQKPPAMAAAPARSAVSPVPAAAPKAEKKGGGNTMLFVGIGGGLLLLAVAAVVIVGIVLASRGGGDTPADEPVGVAETDGGGDTVAAAAEGEPEQQEGEEVAVVEEPTEEPTPTTEPTPEPTPFPEPYVYITGITLDGTTYVVNYETYGYTEALPGEHIHFFFNTVSPDQAGVPGNGPWAVYGGPRPFTQYGTGVKPAGATQLCALFANADHTVVQNTGNCVDLPG